MSRSLFWLSDEAWDVIEAHLPKNQPGARRVDDRRVISGIIHMLKCGAAGLIVPPNMARRQRSTTAGTGGAAGASGPESWRR